MKVNVITRMFLTLAIFLFGTIVISPALGEPAPDKTGWNLTLAGDFHTVISQEEFEKNTDYHQPEHHFASLVDSEGKVWDGMPLQDLAKKLKQDAGTVLTSPDNGAPGNQQQNQFIMTVTGSDGKELTLEGEEIFGKNNYILANAVNGNPLTATDAAYPLILVGKDLNKDDFISGVSTITLHHD